MYLDKYELQDKFRGMSEIVISSLDTSVVPDGIFSNNTGIKYVEISDGVNSILDYAFSGCENLRRVVIPQSVKFVGIGAFEGCSRLKSIKLPDSLISDIEAETFHKCDSLEYIIIPEGVKKIGINAFSECTSLKRIFLPHSLEEIEDSAFENCCNLERVEGAGSIKRIGENAFEGCNSLSEFPFSTSLEYVGDNAFYSSIKLPYYILTRQRAEDCGLLMESETVSVPQGITCITESSLVRTEDIRGRRFDDLFENCDMRWESVQLPESVKNISKYAFLEPCSLWVDYTMTLSERCAATVPKEMNMPKNYFRQKTVFDYEMAFLLADTVWKDYVCDRDFETMILHHDSEIARSGAGKRLSDECSVHLKNMLRFTNNSPLQYEHMAQYAATYANSIDTEVIEVLRKRAAENKAYKAEKILEKYCVRHFSYKANSICDYCFRFLDIFEAEMYFKKIGEPSINYVRWKKSDEYVPEGIVLAVLYAYIKQVPGCIGSASGIPEFQKVTYADIIASEFDKKSFMRCIDRLNIHSGNIELALPVCRYGSGEKIAELLRYYRSDLHLKNITAEKIVINALKLSKAEQALAEINRSRYENYTREMKKGE